MRILLVEDDKELCEAIKLQLEKAGYETDCCGSGQEAFYYAAEFPYDVILLDRMLPQMDGLSVLNGLRRMGVATPVIITTALDGINDRIDGLDAGADDYLVKPYAPGELLARIQYKPGSGKAGTDRTVRHGPAEQTGIRTYGVPDPQCRADPDQRNDPLLHMGA